MWSLHSSHAHFFSLGFARSRDSSPALQERDPYLSGGYAALQSLLADWFLAVETGAEYASPPRAHASFAADSIGFAAFPTVRHVEDTFKAFVGLQFQIMHVLAYLWPFSRLVRALVEEKEEGTRALLELLGVPASTLWCSWALLYALQFAAVGAFAVAALFYRVYSQTSLALIAALYGAYACAVVALAFLLSTLFARARTAGTVSAFALLLAFVPYFAVSGAATSRAAKLVLGLLAPTSFALALDRLLEYQAGSQGMHEQQWSMSLPLPCLAYVD